MDRERLDKWVGETVCFTFSRSGGPGGQNVNKVNTKVMATVKLADAPLGAAEMAQVRERLSNRINANDEIAVQSMRGRTQLENRKRATARLQHLLAAAATPEKKRRPTRRSARANERRIMRKRAHGEKKRRRAWGGEE